MVLHREGVEVNALSITRLSILRLKQPIIKPPLHVLESLNNKTLNSEIETRISSESGLTRLSLNNKTLNSEIETANHKIFPSMY